MTFLIQQTLIYAVPLMIVALAGVFAERSGIINLALEGIMIFGAFIGVLFVNLTQKAGVFAEAKAAGDWVALQGFMVLAMLVAAIMGAVFSLLLSFASVNLKADQTIGGTALNLLAPALVLFFIRIIANQNTLQMAEGDSASWFMIKKSFFGYGRGDEMGFFGSTFIDKTYLATYICILESTGMIHFDGSLIETRHVHNELIKFIVALYKGQYLLQKLPSFSFAAEVRPHTKANLNGRAFSDDAKEPDQVLIFQHFIVVIFVAQIRVYESFVVLRVCCHIIK